MASDTWVVTDRAPKCSSTTRWASQVTGSPTLETTLLHPLAQGVAYGSPVEHGSLLFWPRPSTRGQSKKEPSFEPSASSGSDVQAALSGFEAVRSPHEGRGSFGHPGTGRAGASPYRRARSRFGSRPASRRNSWHCQEPFSNSRQVVPRSS